MSKKGKNILMIATILVVLIIIGIIVYFLMNKNPQGNDTNKSGNNEIENLVSKYYGGFIKKSNDILYVFKDLTNEVKVGMAIASIDSEKITSVDYNTLKNYDFEITCLEENNTRKLISIDLIEEKYKELFNDELPISTIATSSSIGYYYELHTIDEKSYYLEQSFCGGPYGILYNNYSIDTYNYDDDKLYVNVKVGINWELANNEYNGGEDVVKDGIEHGYMKDPYTFKLTFIKKDGNYILVSSEEV